LKSSENSSIHIISTPYNKNNGQLSMPSNTLTQEKAGLECLQKVLMEVFIHDWRKSMPGTSRLIRPGEIATFGNRYDDGIQANVTVDRRTCGRFRGLGSPGVSDAKHCTSPLPCSMISKPRALRLLDLKVANLSGRCRLEGSTIRPMS